MHTQGLSTDQSYKLFGLLLGHSCGTPKTPGAKAQANPGALAGEIVHPGALTVASPHPQDPSALSVACPQLLCLMGTGSCASSILPSHSQLCPSGTGAWKQDHLIDGT